MRLFSRVVSVLGALVVGLMLILNPGAATARPASGQIPEVESLIGKDFRSVLTKGLAQVGARSLRVEFFEHSGNPEQDSAPTLLFSAGCIDTYSFSRQLTPPAGIGLQYVC